MNRRSLAAALRTLIGVLCLSVVVACGGVGSGGTGMPSGSTQGTVNGFGSVIVDGVRYDDSQVPTLREDAPGVETQTAAMLGDSLEVEHTTAGVATRVLVDAALVGNVTGLGASGSFVVLGQTVTVNNSAARGPITQFSGGYTGSASVTAGDAVEVHGLVVPQGSGFTIQATRVGRLSAVPAYVKVTGLVSKLASGAFNLGPLLVQVGTASVLPQGSALANGAAVSVLAPRGALTSAAGGTPQLVAAQIRIKKVGAVGDPVSLSGVIANLDTLAMRFELGGVSVAYGAASVAPAGTSLSAGRYVRVSGKAAADGSVQADTVTVRDGVDEPEAELNGNITGYVPATKHFVVRGVTVDASSATLDSCPAGGLADGLYVEIGGGLSPTGVVATRVHCQSESAGSTVERTGIASAVDTTAATFVLTPSSGTPITVHWTASTYFNDVTAATLAGKRLEVQGGLVNGVLTAQTIEPD
jgi:hypothetical protein